MTFPFVFIPRKKPEKQPLTQFHNVLLQENVDLAFEVVWENVSVAALNPCEDTHVTKPEILGTEEGYGGYSKRWLTIPAEDEAGRPCRDNSFHLAISPFTVKSAVANGVALLLGSCYRVNTLDAPHPGKVNDGTFYQTGRIKRHRADMANSLPGIVETLEDVIKKNGREFRKIKIKKVKELFCQLSQCDDGTAFVQGQTYKAQLQDVIRNNNPVRKKIVSIYPSNHRAQGFKDVVCHKEYSYGMDTQLSVHTNTDHFSKGYTYRFYLQQSSWDYIEDDLPNEYFLPLDDLKRLTYMGSFKKLDTSLDGRDNGVPWYDDLTHLAPGDFVYYQRFTDENGNHTIGGIGKNFQFKPLFVLEDTLPEGHETCRSFDEACPRCRMFGMTVKKETDNEGDSEDEGENGPEGFKGRFKAQTLVSRETFVKIRDTEKAVPFFRDREPREARVPLGQWAQCPANQAIRSFQVLLPLLAGPKCVNRNKTHYFDKKSGNMRGAKTYVFSNQSLDKKNFDQTLRKVDNNRTLHRPQGGGNESFHYAHKQRTFAQAADKGLHFTGVLGASNCNADEAAALFTLLDSRIGSHLFALGLGKSLGMGRFTSRIVKVWIRKKASYASWEPITLSDTAHDLEDLKSDLGSIISSLPERVRLMSEITAKQSDILRTDEDAFFPSAGMDYFRSTNDPTVYQKIGELERLYIR